MGLSFHTLEGKTYWHESTVYEFTASEINQLEKATNTLHEMCLQAVDHVIQEERYAELHIPPTVQRAISESWENDPPSIYGRFDLAFDGNQPPKLLEYNADTPSSLLEAAVIQWHWLQEVMPSADQFNSIWEGLQEKWQTLKEEGYFKNGIVHFACMDADEDFMTTAVLMDTAREAGLEVCQLFMQDIGWDHDWRRFVDVGHRPIETLFKLYPWEWLIQDEFGPYALELGAKVNWIEPIWKMILSNKGILAILWEMFPGHPNLLPAYRDGPNELTNYVAKPFLSREGQNVRIQSNGISYFTPGDYGDGPQVFQEHFPLPCFEGNYAVIGSWVIDGAARGIGIRESDGPITEDHARFVPHYFNPN